MKGAERVVRLSVLDRLIRGDQPQPRTARESMDAVKEAVLRDIEWLLNTRRIAQPAPPSLEQLHDSVYHFGIPDITSMSADSRTRRRELLRHIEDCLARFEPRLTSVRVVEHESGEHSPLVRFQVEAILRMQTEAEPIYFQTVLEPVSGRFNVPQAD